MPRRRQHGADIDAAQLKDTLEELKQSDAPLKRRANDINKVYDRNGTPLSFFPHVPTILFWLQAHRIPIAVASRTSAPDVARQALRGLHLIDESSSAQERPGPVPAISLFQHMEIYPGSKIHHFRAIHKALDIDYESMVFFDDEYRNAEVGTELGVHFVEVGHPGTDVGTVVKGVKEWQAKHKARHGDPDAGSSLL